MNNKERNELILKLACELLGNLNYEIENAYAEDVEEGQVLVSVTVPNPGGLIGFRGRNLASLQLILALMVKQKVGEWVKVLLDINNYRNEQKDRLTKMTQSLAQKVLVTGQPVEMATMSAYERRLCHMALTEIEGVTGDSEGEGEERHIVIKPKSL
jgi:spoIIIJ-associated protein